MAADPLVCPSCATPHPADERFCRSCGMPLVLAGGPSSEPPNELRERLRKIKPQYTEGELVRVAGGRNQAEAELIQGLLLEEGIPSIVKRTLGFDVPDMLAAGPRDVLVPASGAQAAGEVLLQADMLPDTASSRVVERPGLLLAWLLASVALVAIVAWLGTELL